MKPTIRKHKHVRGKVLGYSAQLGPIESNTQPDKPRAIAECESFTLAALDRLGKGPTIARWQGHVLIVYPTPAGWAYWLDTFSNGYGNDVSLGADPIVAYNRAVYHLAQTVWDHQADDHALIGAVPDVAARAELAGWIAFQRTYQQIKTAGEITEENQIHRAACDAGPVYAREHFASYLHAARREARA